MTMTLEPCPFCGGEASLCIGYHARFDAKVVCNDCSSEGALYGEDDFKGDAAEQWKQGAIAAWNRRAHLSQPAQAVDGTGRSDKDYAIEHAGYMARGATGLIAAVNDLELARQQFDEGGGSSASIDKAEQSLGDAMSALRSLIYEFEKRRDRALSPAQADGWRVPDYMIRFLLGEGPLEGFWFGDKPATEKGGFWWRKRLRSFNPAHPAPDKEGKA